MRDLRRRLHRWLLSTRTLTAGGCPCCPPSISVASNNSRAAESAPPPGTGNRNQPDFEGLPTIRGKPQGRSRIPAVRPRAANHMLQPAHESRGPYSLEVRQSRRLLVCRRPTNLTAQTRPCPACSRVPIVSHGTATCRLWTLPRRGASWRRSLGGTRRSSIYHCRVEHGFYRSHGKSHKKPPTQMSPCTSLCSTRRTRRAAKLLMIRSPRLRVPG